MEWVGGLASCKGNNHAWNQLGRALHPKDPFTYSTVLNILELVYLHQRRSGPNQGKFFTQLVNFNICFIPGLSSTDFI